MYAVRSVGHDGQTRLRQQINTMRANGDFVQSPVPNAPKGAGGELYRAAKLQNRDSTGKPNSQKLSEMDALRWARNLLFLLPVGLGCALHA